MLQKDFLFAEPQFMCDVCSEAVTNPICPMCLTTEIEAWLTLYPNLRNELLPSLYEHLKKIQNKPVDSTMCIKCKNKRASVCPYCFTEKVLRELEKLSANKMILQEFFEFFNFDLHHTGYTKYAEEIDII